MSDRFNVMFSVGGEVTKTALERLVAVAEAERFGLDWGEEYNQKELLVSARDAAKRKVTLDLLGSEIAWGDTDALNEVCRENGIEFTASVYGRYEYSGECHWWRKDMFLMDRYEEMEPACNYAMISVTGLKNLLEKGHSLETVIKTLNNTPPPLPPLKIIK